jgi:predicted Rossmann fold nucleotide-binding protein DprA/Smf involved in DNA uptake
LLNLQHEAEAKAVVDEKSLAALSPIEQKLLEAMGYYTIHIDDLAERVDIAVGTLASALIGLELQGFVRQLGSGYQRV